MEKVSVIIPAYQSENTIKKCIDSLLDQTWTNVELIIVDDGSTDRTAHVLNDIKKMSSFDIKIISQKNCGVSVARNHGLQYVTGKYLTFVDSDDLVSRDYIKTLVKAMKEQDSDFVADIPRTGNNKVREEKIVWQGNLSELGPIFGPQYKKMRFNNVCAKLYKTKIAKRLRFPRNVRIGEDLLFNLKYLSLCNSIVLLDTNGYSYVENGSSATHRFHYDDFENQKMLYLTVLEFYSHISHETSSCEIRYIYVKNMLELILLLTVTKTISFNKKISDINKLRNDAFFNKELESFVPFNTTLKLEKKLFCKGMLITLLIFGACYNLKVKLCS